MKIKNIIPVTGPVITPEMIKYIRKYLSPDTELSTSQIKVGTPSIECEYDEAMAGRMYFAYARKLKRRVVMEYSSTASVTRLSKPHAS